MAAVALLRSATQHAAGKSEFACFMEQWNPRRWPTCRGDVLATAPQCAPAVASGREQVACAGRRAETGTEAVGYSL